MRKNFIFDTSVVVQNPFIFKYFSDCDIILPITVLDELDKLKKQAGDAGKNARVFIRLLDEITDRGDISIGILIDNEVLIKIDNSDYEIKGDKLYGDTRILACASYHNTQVEDLTFVSNDINLRVRAKALGINTEKHEGEKLSYSELYEGTLIINDENMGAELLDTGSINPEDYNLELYPHQCIMIRGEYDNHIALGRKVSDTKIKLIKQKYPWSLHAKNAEQVCALDLLLDNSVDLITMTGKAGCGKSLLALAAALELVLEKNMYDKLIIFRPVEPMGRDLGFLPGLESEKLEPWFRAIMDSFELLFSSSNKEKWRQTLEMYKKKEKIKFEPLTYIRGRSIANAVILAEEIQNLSSEEVKTILTRAGKNTKIILNGDLDQIDRKDLDATNNGLAYVIEKFKDQDIAGHITFKKSERSLLAEISSEIL